jgi:hypothetical protein
MHTITSFFYRNRKTSACFCLLLLLLAVGFQSSRQTLFFGAATVNGSLGTRTKIGLPHLLQAPKDELLTFEFQVYRPPSASGIVKLLPDDCLQKIEINGRDFPLSQYDSSQLCNFKKGMIVDFGNSLPVGTSLLRVTVENGHGGLSGVFFQSAEHWSRTGPLLQCEAGVAAFIFYCLLRFIGLDAGAAVILTLAFLLRLLYFACTPPTIREYDAFERGGHFYYIQYVLEHWSLPPRTVGWEYHQPPLYYLFSALLVRFTGVENTLAYLAFLQLESLFFALVFLIFSALLISELIRNTAARWMSIALCSFWPSSILHSVRIGNDMALYALVSIALFLLVRWWERESESDLQAAAWWTAAAMAVKTSALIFAGLTVTLMLCARFRRSGRSCGRRQHALVIAILAGAFLVEQWSNVSLALNGTSMNWLVGTTWENINADLLVDNSWYRFVLFDYDTFLRVPFISSLDDATGRQFFWNYLLKTSLFGEFRFPGPNVRNYAAVLSALLLLLCLILSIHLLKLSRARISERLPLLGGLLLSYAAIFYFRSQLATCVNADFRYIFPVIICFCVFWADEYENSLTEDRPLWSALLFGIAGGIVLCSLCFYLSLAAEVADPLAAFLQQTALVGG